MTFLDHCQLSIKSIFSHRIRTFFTILGIAIGVMAVVLLTALGEGSKQYVKNEFDSLGGDLLAVLPGHSETQGAGAFNHMISNTIRDLTLDDVKAVERRSPLIKRAIPVTIGNLPVQYRSLSKNTTIVCSVKGYDTINNLKIVSGSFLPADFEQADFSCVLGANIKKDLFPHENPLGKVVELGDWKFRVIGITSSKGNTLGIDFDDLVFIPVSTGMRIFNQTSLFRIILKCRNVQSLKAATKQVKNILLDRHDQEHDFTVIEPSALQDSFLDILNILSTFLIGVATISLAVAGFGVMNLMLITITERRAEIGLYKAIGAQTSHILGIFLAESTVLSVCGGVVGVLIGLLSVQLVTLYFPSFPAYAPLWSILSALVLSTVVGILFGVIPAYKATRVNAIEALMS